MSFRKSLYWSREPAVGSGIASDSNSTKSGQASVREMNDYQESGKSLSGADLLPTNGSSVVIGGSRSHGQLTQNRDTDKAWAELQLANSRILELQAKEQILRNFILKNDAPQSVSEEAILHQFTQLRQQAQRLAFNKAYRVGQQDLSLPKLNSSGVGRGPSGDEEYAYLSALWDKSPRSIRLKILQATIFQMLKEKILDREIFQIDEAVNGEMGIPNASLVMTLGHFERIIVNRGVSRDVVTDWRLSTFKCIQDAGLGGMDVIADEISEDMHAFFKPLMAVVTLEDRTKLSEGYRRLCKEAWRLRLAMRYCRETYECPSIPRCRAQGLEYLCEIFGDISGDFSGVEEVDIAFTVFGALIKHSRFPGEQPKVLEKAHVIVTTSEIIF